MLRDKQLLTKGVETLSVTELLPEWQQKRHSARDGPGVANVLHAGGNRFADSLRPARSSHGIGHRRELPWP